MCLWGSSTCCAMCCLGGSTIKYCVMCCPRPGSTAYCVMCCPERLSFKNGRVENVLIFFNLLTQFPHVSKSVLIVQPFESEHQSIQILIRTQLQSFNQLLHSFDDILLNFLDGNYNFLGGMSGWLRHTWCRIVDDKITINCTTDASNLQRRLGLGFEKATPVDIYFGLFGSICEHVQFCNLERLWFNKGPQTIIVGPGLYQI